MDNYPPGITERDIDNQFGDETEVFETPELEIEEDEIDDDQLEETNEDEE